MVNPKSEGNASVIQLNCTIIPASGNNYTVNCPTNGNNDYDFQNALSYIEKDILLINVDYITNGSSTVQEPEKNGTTYFRTRNKSSSGLSGGAIAGIVIAPVVVVAALLAVIFLTRKTTNVNNQSSIDTTKENVKI